MEQTEIKQKISTTKNNTNETSERQKKRSFFGDNLCYFFHAVTEVAMILMLITWNEFEYETLQQSLHSAIALYIIKNI